MPQARAHGTPCWPAGELCREAQTQRQHSCGLCTQDKRKGAAGLQHQPCDEARGERLGVHHPGRIPFAAACCPAQPSPLKLPDSAETPGDGSELGLGPKGRGQG